jgi:Na+-transporting methylmalonyl-CoA/oxaloacetate decarboxylase gamma subunit
LDFFRIGLTVSVTEQLLTGLELTLTGMVTVFALLAFMVLVIGWMSRLAHHLQPPPSRRVGLGDKRPGGEPDAALVSAIGAAVHRYRKKHR